MTPLQWKRFFYRIGFWVAILGLLFLIAVLGSTTWRVFTKGQEAERLHKGAKESVAELHERKIAVEDSLRQLDTPRGIEEEIRKRYELGLPGEEQIVLVTDPDAENAPKNEDEGFWATVQGWFKR